MIVSDEDHQQLHEYFQRFYISSCTLLPFRFVTGLYVELDYGLKPQVSGIKIVIAHSRSIFQVEWLIATLVSSFISLSKFSPRHKVNLYR